MHDARHQCAPYGASHPHTLRSDNQRVLALQAVSLLARSVKEHARRNGEKLGFSEAPGDCLAFTYYRDVSPDRRAIYTTVSLLYVSTPMGLLSLFASLLQSMAHLCISNPGSNLPVPDCAVLLQ